MKIHVINVLHVSQILYTVLEFIPCDKCLGSYLMHVYKCSNFPSIVRQKRRLPLPPPPVPPQLPQRARSQRPRARCLPRACWSPARSTRTWWWRSCPWGSSETRWFEHWEPALTIQTEPSSICSRSVNDMLCVFSFFFFYIVVVSLG